MYTDMNLEVIVKETENPNDWASTEAVDLFFSRDGTAVGRCSVSGLNTDSPLLYNLEVADGQMDKGYGSAIVEYCVEHYGANQLSVDVANEKAIHIYEKYGFEKSWSYYSAEEKAQMYVMMRCAD